MEFTETPRRRRGLGAGALAVAVAAVLSACAPAAPPIGHVTGEVRGGHPLRVTVRAGTVTVTYDHVEPNQSFSVRALPLGPVTITARGVCTLTTTLTAKTLHVVVGETHCAV
jgi:hypothetical protein